MGYLEKKKCDFTAFDKSFLVFLILLRIFVDIFYNATIVKPICKDNILDLLFRKFHDMYKSYVNLYTNCILYPKLK